MGVKRYVSSCQCIKACVVLWFILMHLWITRSMTLHSHSTLYHLWLNILSQKYIHSKLSTIKCSWSNWPQLTYQNTSKNIFDRCHSTDSLSTLLLSWQSHFHPINQLSFSACCRSRPTRADRLHRADTPITPLHPATLSRWAPPSLTTGHQLLHLI